MNAKTAARRFGLPQAAVLLMLLLGAAAMAKTLFCGLEIDEEYALSIGYRLVKGDTLFYTMWEPHQLSALTAAGLIALYMALAHTTTGILLFVRAVLLGVKALLAFCLYRELKPRLGRLSAFLAAMVVFVYTPKWFLSPDYISQQFHYTLAAFLFFYDYYTHDFRRPWQIVPGAVCLSMSFLAFPQSVMAAPVLFIGMIVMGRRCRGADGRREPTFLAVPRGAWLPALGCLLSAGAFAAYLFRGVPFALFGERANLILNDPQYDFSTAERLALLGGQVVNVTALLAKPLAAALALAAAGCARDIWRRHTGPVRNIRFWLNVFFTAWCAFSILLCLFRAVRDSSLDERYFCPVLVLAGIWFFRSGKGTDREPLFWLGYLPGAAAYLFILRSTLLGLAPTFMYLSWPALCAVLALCHQAREADAGVMTPCTPFALAETWPRLLLCLLFAFLVVCRGWLVLVTGWLPANMADTPLQKVTSGPAAGTWMDDDAAEMYGALALALTGHGGEKVLLSTGDVHGLAYLMEDGTLSVGQASVISSTDSDVRFASYYNELPEKVPDVILYNRDCVRDLDTFHDWIAANLTVTGQQEVTVGHARLTVLTVDSSRPPKTSSGDAAAQSMKTVAPAAQAAKN